MKKIITTVAAILLVATMWAQAPEKMSYQAVIRNTSNNLATNQGVGIQVSILKGGASGTAVFVETHNVTTNINGLVTLEIGTGTLVSGDFTTIDWAADTYFIQTETDPTTAGGTNYTITGTTQLMSVPYALHAKTAESVTGTITETDPIFGASIANGITVLDTANWNNKLAIEVDGSITNEIQKLSLSGNNLTISGAGGNTVVLPTSTSSPWTVSGDDIYRISSGSVGINKTNLAVNSLFHISDGDDPYDGIDNDADGSVDEVGEELVFTNTRRLGIGTITPTEKLEVNGNIKNVSSAPIITIEDNDNLGTDGNYQSYIQGTDMTDTTIWYVGEGSYGKLVGLMASRPGYRLFLGTNGVEQLSIDSVGNIKINNGRILQDAFQTPSYAVNWSDYAGYEGVTFYKDKEGRVQMQGLARYVTANPADNTVIFTLPIGYRPSANLIFSNTLGGNIIIKATGDVVTANSVVNNWVSFSGVSFRIN